MTTHIYGTPVWQKVEILLWTVDIYWGRLRFYYERLRFSWKQIEIFMMTKVEIFMMTLSNSDFYDDRSSFSWWQVEIFMIAGQDFYDNRLRFSWWFQVKNFSARETSHNPGQLPDNVVICLRPIHPVNSILIGYFRWYVGH